MADVNDAGNISGKHAAQLAKITGDDESYDPHEEEVDPRDLEAIELFHAARQSGAFEGPVKPNTLISDLSGLRCAAERSDTALVDMGQQEYEALVIRLTDPPSVGGYGLQPDGDGMYNYCRVLKLFFRYLTERPEYGSYEWGENIDIPSRRTDAPDAADLLTPAEVEELKQATANGQNESRDRALVAFLADGPRVTLAAQLRIKDIDISDPRRAVWRPNRVGEGQKGVPIKERVFLWSLADVRVWVNKSHPAPDNGEAPLWVDSMYTAGSADDITEHALSPDGIRSLLNRLADRTGITKRTNPHSFRHAALTRLSSHAELTPQQLQHAAGWTDDEMRMLSIYDSSEDKRRNDNIRRALGQEVAQEPEESTSHDESHDCPNCLRQGIYARHCPNCGIALNPAERIDTGPPLWLQTYYDLSASGDELESYLRDAEPREVSDLSHETYSAVADQLLRRLFEAMGTGEPITTDEAAGRFCTIFGGDGVFRNHSALGTTDGEADSTIRSGQDPNQKTALGQALGELDDQVVASAWSSLARELDGEKHRYPAIAELLEGE
jgi:integrase